MYVTIFPLSLGLCIDVSSPETGRMEAQGEDSPYVICMGHSWGLLSSVELLTHRWLSPT